MQLLATDVVSSRVDLDALLEPDRGHGAVSLRVQPGLHRRADRDGIVLEARADPARVVLAVHGPPGTPPDRVAAALAAAHRWAGLTDDARGFAAMAQAHPVVAELHRRLGAPRLSSLPRVAEAVGRAVIYQLVQAEEARRSCMKVTATLGTTVGQGLWCWPSHRQVRAAGDWDLRRCGVSRRGATTLRAAAVHRRRLEEAVGDWALLDRRLRALPGCGAWTSGTVRLALGDPDAVPVGDYNLPAFVGQVLGGEPTDDEGMLSLLAPFAGHRGRVLTLLQRAARAGFVRRRARRAPRAALSAHRYW